MTDEGMKAEEFFDAAKEKYGEKIFVGKLLPSQESLDKMREQGYIWDIEMFEEYEEHAWLLEPKCPECGDELLGMFGTFEWGIVHGVGACSQCNKTMFRYYHYLGNCRKPFQMFSLIGF